MLTWQSSGGFSVDASVRIEAKDRAGIERLVRGEAFEFNACRWITRSAGTKRAHLRSEGGPLLFR